MSEITIEELKKLAMKGDSFAIDYLKMLKIPIPKVENVIQLPIDKVDKGENTENNGNLVPSPMYKHSINDIEQQNVLQSKDENRTFRDMVALRVSEQVQKNLIEYCKRTRTNRSEAIKKAIHELLEKNK